MKQEVELFSCNIHVIKKYIDDYITDGYIIDSVASQDEYTWILILHKNES